MDKTTKKTTKETTKETTTVKQTEPKPKIVAKKSTKAPRSLKEQREKETQVFHANKTKNMEKLGLDYSNPVIVLDVAILSGVGIVQMFPSSVATSTREFQDLCNFMYEKGYQFSGDRNVKVTGAQYRQQYVFSKPLSLTT